MKKLGLVVLSIMLVGLVAGSSLADVPASFSLSGDVELPTAYRSKEINTFHNGALSHSDTILTPLITINTKWELAEKVTAIVQFENRRVSALNDAGAAATGTASNVDLGGADNISPAIEQAYIRVGEFFSPKLTMSYGIQDLKFTLREGEGAFFMDVSEAQTYSVWLPMDSQIAANAATARGVSEFSGFLFNYGSLKDDNYQVDFMYGVTRQTGAARANDNLVGVNVAYKLPGEKNVLKVLIAQMNNPDTNGGAALNTGLNAMTIGFGVDYFGAVPNLELYFEYYNQTGTLSNIGVNAAGQVADVDQVASAYRLGGRYDFVDVSVKPYVDLSMWNVSGGDDSNAYKSASVKYTENNHFISYENSQSTMILEDSLYGLDLDSNYNAIKIEAGIKTSLKLGGNSMPLNLKMLIGQFTLDTPPFTNTAGPDGLLLTGDDVAKAADDALGMEVDIKATLKYSDNVDFVLGLGMLSGGDFFDSIAFTNPTPTNAGAYETFDSMTLLMFGANVKF
ncbi:MAG: hypothetical protein HY811_09085 [Planctomycetes bacterium]|nr:hypothetical protein [Planctomycetota bacterium]